MSYRHRVHLGWPFGRFVALQDSGNSMMREVEPFKSRGSGAALYAGRRRRPGLSDCPMPPIPPFAWFMDSRRVMCC